MRTVFSLPWSICHVYVGLCGRGETGRRIGLKPLSALGETPGAELLKVGETFTGNPEPSPSPEGKV